MIKEKLKLNFMDIQRKDSITCMNAEVIIHFPRRTIGMFKYPPKTSD